MALSESLYVVLFYIRKMQNAHNPKPIHDNEFLQMPNMYTKFKKVNKDRRQIFPVLGTMWHGIAYMSWNNCRSYSLMYVILWMVGAGETENVKYFKLCTTFMQL